MPETLRIALGRMNPRPADPAANAARIAALRAEAAAAGADLLLTPHLSLCGAVTAAAAADPGLDAALGAALGGLAAEAGPALVLGAPWRDGARLHDALHLIGDGAVRARRAAHAPGGGFDPGPVPGPVAFRGARLGLMAGADWRDAAVAETLAETGAGILVALDSLPAETGGEERVLQAALARVVETGLPLLLLNRLGAEGEAVRDGAALVLDAGRAPALRLPPFAEGVVLTGWTRDGDAWRPAPHPAPPAMAPEEALWRALLLALREHARRHGAARLLVPLEDTAEAALAAVLAADALGPGAVTALGAGMAPDAARRLGLVPEALDLAPAARALAAALPDAADPLPRLRALAVAALAEARGAVPVVTGPAPPPAFAPLRHLDAATRRALAAWRDAARPPDLPGPDAPGLPVPPGTSPPPPDATPWPEARRADYKRGLPPGPRFAPRASTWRPPEPDEGPSP